MKEKQDLDIREFRIQMDNEMEKLSARNDAEAE